MFTIYKYELEATDINIITMPRYAHVLSIQIDKKTGKPCIWCQIDTGDELVNKKFRIYGTGHEINNAYGYLGTFQLENGEFIGHVYECYGEI